MQKIENKIGWKDFFNLISMTNPPKKMIVLAFLFDLLSTGVSLCIPLIAKKFIDSSKVADFNYQLVVPLIFFFFLSAITSGVSIYVLNKIGQSIVLNIRKKLLDKLLKLPLKYYDNGRVGDMSSRIINDAQVLKGVISDHLINFISGVITIFGSCIALILIDYKLTFMLLGSSLLILFVVIPFSRKIYRISQETQENIGEMNSRINGALSEIKLVKSSHAESFELTRGKEQFEKMFTLGLKEGKLQALMSPALSLLTFFLAVIVIGYGGIRVVSGSLSMGNLTAFALYMFQLFVPLTQLVYVYSQIQRSKAASERAIQTLSGETEDFSGSVDIPWNAEIIFDSIDFEYEESIPVLSKISLTISPKNITAIVGPSGSGKSTLFCLLERFYYPTNGNIKIGNLEINSLSLGEWRKNVGYVSQEISIIAGTILENLLYGQTKETSVAEVENAIRIANLDEFIEKLPGGLDTNVGERGVRLSGGQRQRIGIARAILKNPQLLLLDEATSNLDSISEMKVTESLKDFMKDRTTIIIAHRLSTVLKADQIIFLDNGKITGQGTHSYLLNSHDKYREFASNQLFD